MPNHLLYQAPQQQIADPDTGTVTREWYLWFMEVLQALTSAGDVFGPGTSVNNEIVLWSGTTGTELKSATGTGIVNAVSGVYQTPYALGDNLVVTSGPTLNSLDFVVLSDGANPPTPVNDGAGNFVYVAYHP